jgi:protein tyrosine phosphatase (PTP) superfamily phosphohydrolase (DUF442 family)
MLKVRLFKYLLVAVSMVSASFVVAQSEPAMNFHRLNDRLATGGHLIEGGAAELKEQGVTVVINLRDDSPTEEQQQFIDQGIEWINIPVEWRNPESSDYARFSEIMSEYEDDHVLVQCSSNYRASAMTYLYQVVEEGASEEEAKQHVLEIWNPDNNETWTNFFNEVKAGAE